jgi:phospholipid transport system transporter-binding protein
VKQVQFEIIDDERVRLSGELNFSTVSGLEEQSKKLFKENNSIILDLKEVKRADSAGVALLVEWVRQAESHHCKVNFTNIPEQMLSIARVSALDTILPLIRD